MNVGIIGAGNIAGKMAGTLDALKAQGVVAYSVASRDAQKARDFAAKHKIKKAFGSYEDMLADAALDLVYVATPHSHHAEHMKLCLNAGKHVLCEKAFTQTAQQAKEVLSLAAEKKLLAAEAIWTRYLPARKLFDDVLESGLIGEAVSLTANLCYPIDTVERMVKPELAGGALLDLGVYTINFAFMTRGFESSAVKTLDSTAILAPSGVDAASSTTITYASGKIAMLNSDMRVLGDRRGMVFGTKGFAEFENINNCEGINVFDLNYKLIKKIKPPKQITGFEYEVLACKNALENGKIECAEMPHAQIITVMGTMDAIKAAWKR
ncbi:MAG: Gfo/Idh/MocA family oxidoreductase [Treponemataceae bacterium]|nr:MAG: Gfo/Idh/MocA family oxidoreductase [Treponemataceae bacterium]